MKKATFEENMTRLEEIVSLLEQGDAPLSESLALFSEGSKLLAACRKELDTAQQKVVKLSKGPDGAPAEETFYPRRKINELSRTIYRLSGGY